MTAPAKPRRWIRQLRAMGACEDAIAWAEASPHRTLRAAWAACPRGDWMLWLAGKFVGAPWSDSRRPLVGVAAECAMLMLPIPDEYEVARQWACDAALRWARGEAEREEVEAAADAAYAAAYAADAAYAAAYAADATNAAAYAAYATNAAAYAAYATNAAAYAAYATNAAAYAAYDAADDAEIADIVRRWYPEPPSLEVTRE